MTVISIDKLRELNNSINEARMDHDNDDDDYDDDDDNDVDVDVDDDDDGDNVGKKSCKQSSNYWQVSLAGNSFQKEMPSHLKTDKRAP